jgi:hypothetical protein
MARGDTLTCSIMWYEFVSYLFIFPIFRLVDLTNLGQFSFIVRVFDFWTIALEDNNRTSFNQNSSLVGSLQFCFFSVKLFVICIFILLLKSMELRMNSNFFRIENCNMSAKQNL